VSSSRFPILRGDDAQQSRVQDNVSALVGPLAKALQATPIMGAAAPSPILPSLLNGWTSNSTGIAVVSFHRDALGYVHVGGYAINAVGVAGFATTWLMPLGYRPAALRIFAVRGTAITPQFVEVGNDGIVRTQLAVAAGGDCTFEFSYLAGA